MNYKAQIPNEENNYPKAIAIASGIMGFLLLISFFIVIGSFQPPEEVGMGGMVVNYGTSAEGMGDDYTSIEEPSADPNANGKPPEKVTPEEKVTPTTSTESSDKEVQTQNTEDAIAVNTKPTKPTKAAPTPVTEDKPAKPVINQNALYKGKKNTGQGQGDGTGKTPGNQGDKDGDPLASNYGEGGSGNGMYSYHWPAENLSISQGYRMMDKVQEKLPFKSGLIKMVKWFRPVPEQKALPYLI